MTEHQLTDRQREILDVIDRSMRERGLPAVGPRDRRGGRPHLALHGAHPPRTLQRLGFLRRDPTKPRAIEVRWDPNSGAAVERRPVRHVPLVGDVAAGTDVLAQENVEELLPLPADFTGDGDLFMLRVRGDSMIDAGILDGDFVVARAQPTADKGDIVVAGIPGEEATVKTYTRKGGQGRPACRPTTGSRPWSSTPDEVHGLRQGRHRPAPPLSAGHRCAMASRRGRDEMADASPSADRSASLAGRRARRCAAAPAAARSQAAVDDPGLGRPVGPRPHRRRRRPGRWRPARASPIAIVDSGVDADHPDLAGQVAGIVDCVGHDDGRRLHRRRRHRRRRPRHPRRRHRRRRHRQRPGRRRRGARRPRSSPSGCSPTLRATATTPPAPTARPRAPSPTSPQGVRWAADHGADVINLSLGSVAQAIVGPGDDFADALDVRLEPGRPSPSSSAGNDLLLPGSLVDVPAVVVAATDAPTTTRPTYSNGVGNVRWAVAAPGGEADTGRAPARPDAPNGILSTYYRPADCPTPGSTYACVAGTSMAAPHVLGRPRRAPQRRPWPPGRRRPAARHGRRPRDARARQHLRQPGGSTSPAPSRGCRPPAQDRRLPSATRRQRHRLRPAGPGTTGVVSPGTIAPPAVPGTTAATTTAPPVDTSPTSTPLGEDAGAAFPSPLGDDDTLPAVPLTVAVLAVVALLSAHLWRFSATTSFARRTPRRCDGALRRRSHQGRQRRSGRLERRAVDAVRRREWASVGSPGPKLVAGMPAAAKRATSVQPSLARTG